jgi:hypothetical protein
MSDRQGGGSFEFIFLVRWSAIATDYIEVRGNYIKILTVDETQTAQRGEAATKSGPLKARKGTKRIWARE